MYQLNIKFLIHRLELWHYSSTLMLQHFIQRNILNFEKFTGRKADAPEIYYKLFHLANFYVIAL